MADLAGGLDEADVLEMETEAEDPAPAAAAAAPAAAAAAKGAKQKVFAPPGSAPPPASLLTG